MDYNVVLQAKIPDMAVVYGGVRGRTMSSRRQAHAWRVLEKAGVKHIIDLRQDYQSGLYEENCLLHGMSYFHYPVHKSKETVLYMVKDFDVFGSLIDQGDFFISCAQGVHRTDIALSTYWVFRGADKGKELPTLKGYLKSKGHDAGKIFHVLNLFYSLYTNLHGYEPIPKETFKARKIMINNICSVQ